MKSENEHIHNERVRKRLGQYFTSKELISMLIDIADMPMNISAIDPMAGTGNMLMSLVNKGYAKEKIFGIEIDKVAADICKQRFGKKNIQIANAFSNKAYMDFNRKSWDLVIANPPYVRYQSMGEDNITGIQLPSAKEIRNNLLDVIDYFEGLDEEDKKLFKILVKSYSGLSDMTVPCWILCAAMVKREGKIAMVVPDTWLNRDYGLVVQYLLLKWFEIEYIVEDTNGIWFSNAQIKTNLVIARRRQRREKILDIRDDTYTLVKTFKPDINQGLVYKQNAKRGKIDDILDRNLVSAGIDYNIERRQLNNLVTNVYLSKSKLKWLNKVEGMDMHSINSYPIPENIITQLNICNEDTISLEDCGVQVGQGLRTGANKFFYLKVDTINNDTELLRGDKCFSNKLIEIPKIYTRCVLQKQGDLSEELVINEDNITGRVIYIQDAATNKDLENSNMLTQKRYRCLNKSLEEYILKVEETPLKDGDEKKYIPSLSAVKPNVRIVRCREGEINRFWYMLPVFTARHIPDFCVPRINNNAPNFYMLKQKNTVVDANFSTLWISDECLNNKYAIFGLLNSFWTKACLEYICTVMGGGALKVEATYLKKIPFPKFSALEYEQLNYYGKILSSQKTCKDQINIIDKIDIVILKAILNREDVREELDKIKQIVELKVNQRKR